MVVEWTGRSWVVGWAQMSSGTGKPGEVGLTGFVREGLPVPVFGGSQWEKQPSLLRSPGRKHRSRAEQAGPRPQREAEPEGESASQPGRQTSGRVKWWRRPTVAVRLLFFSLSPQNCLSNSPRSAQTRLVNAQPLVGIWTNQQTLVQN